MFIIQLSMPNKKEYWVTTNGCCTLSYLHILQILWICNAIGMLLGFLELGKCNGGKKCNAKQRCYQVTCRFIDTEYTTGYTDPPCSKNTCFTQE